MVLKFAVTIVILLLTPVLIVQRLPIIVSNFRGLEIVYHTFVTYWWGSADEILLDDTLISIKHELH